MKTINPAMIQLARESRGLDAKQLAKRVNLSEREVLDIEIGMYDVSEDLLADLCRALSYPPTFFYQVFETYPARICTQDSSGTYHSEWCCPEKRMNLRESLRHIEGHA